tara:strand:- start:7 stop:405 length:399 start_codon:yes stop_codon:yes gene_type:complete
MKLSTVLFFSIIFLFSCKSDADKLQIGQKTTIKVNEVHDGGTIIKGEKITAKFNVTNTGKYPLVISSVKGSCSCTIASKPTKPIKPGESKIITAEVKTEKKKVGKLTQSVRMVANTVPSVTVLRITANVVSK